jgi:hypothetical protein
MGYERSLWISRPERVSFMAEKKNVNLIKDICEGGSKQFDGKPCVYYDRSGKKTCRLLQEQRMEEFWEECRVAWEKFYKIWKEELHKVYPDIPAKDSGEFNFTRVVDCVNASLQKEPLKIPKLTVWIGYIRKTVFHEIMGQLRKSKSDFWKHTIPIDTQRSTHDGNEMQTPPRVLHQTSEEVKTSEQEQPESRPLEEILDLLNMLIEEAPQGSTQRKIYERNYEIFVHLVHVLQEVIDEMFAKEIQTKTEKKAFNKKINTLRVEAIKRLAGKFNRTERMIYADLAKILAFLRERGAINF